MDWLTFISNIWNGAGNFAWPVVFLIVLILFREPIKKVVMSLKSLRYKEFEMELVEPKEATEKEIESIVSYLQRSPHSFQWFRDNTEFQYMDDQFSELIAKHPGVLEKITIVSSDKEKRKSTPGLQGMRLTRKYRQMVEKAIQN